MRTMSPAAVAATMALNSSEVFLLLLTISHPDLEDDLRFVNNLESVTSNGELFVAFPFEVELPAQKDDSPGEARIRIDNIDRDIVKAVRTLTSPPTVKFEVIMASSPDTVEAEFTGMVLRNTSYDALIVRGVLRFEDLLSEPVSIQITPSRFPAMF